MSLFCLCIVGNIKKESELLIYTKKVEQLAKHHSFGVKFSVDWTEPILSVLNVNSNSLVINVLDCPESDNCELFLLPDGWYVNGKTNKKSFRNRMKFLQDITNIFADNSHSVCFYLGQSGTHIEEFYDITIRSNTLVDYLIETIGTNGIDDGVCINIIKTGGNFAS